MGVCNYFTIDQSIESLSSSYPVAIVFTAIFKSSSLVYVDTTPPPPPPPSIHTPARSPPRRQLVMIAPSTQAWPRYDLPGSHYCLISGNEIERDLLSLAAWRAESEMFSQNLPGGDICIELSLVVGGGGETAVCKYNCELHTEQCNTSVL